MLKVAGGGGGGSGSGTVTQIDTGTGLTGGPITTTGTVALANTAVVAGTYGNATTVAQITVDAQGRLTFANNVTISASSASNVITATSVNAFTVGRQGTTDPAFNVNTNTANSATGVNITAASAGNGVAVSVLSSGADEALTLNAKGSGTIGIGSVSTGAVTITPATTISGAATLSSTLNVTGAIKGNSTLRAAGNTIVSYVDMGSASYSSISLSVLAQDTGPSSLFFSPDGLKMFMAGRLNDKIYQYNLSTPWVVSSASFVTDFSVSSQTTFPQGIYFKPDGLKLFVVGSSPDEVFQYSLTTPWTISTASYDSISFSVATEDGTPQGIDFSPDGINMYVCGSDNDSVYQYLLSTPWAISTATYVRTLSITGQETVTTSLRFTYDGTRLFLLGATGDDITWYDLSTPWNISTAVYQSQFSVAAQETTPQALYVQPNGETFYIAGSINSTVYQYAMPLVSINLTGDTNLNGNVDIYQNATVAGATALSSTLAVAGATTLSSTLVVTGITTTNTVNFTGTTAANATFGTASLPLSPQGFITVQIGGVSKKIPYYAV